MGGILWPIRPAYRNVEFYRVFSAEGSPTGLNLSGKKCGCIRPDNAHLLLGKSLSTRIDRVWPHWLLASSVCPSKSENFFNKMFGSTTDPFLEQYIRSFHNSSHNALPMMLRILDGGYGKENRKVVTREREKKKTPKLFSGSAAQ